MRCNIGGRHIETSNTRFEQILCSLYTTAKTMNGQAFNNAPLTGEKSVIIPLVFLFGSALSFYRNVRSNRQEVFQMTGLATVLMFAAYWIVYN